MKKKPKVIKRIKQQQQTSKCFANDQTHDQTTRNRNTTRARERARARARERERPERERETRRDKEVEEGWGGDGDAVYLCGTGPFKKPKWAKTAAVAAGGEGGGGRGKWEEGADSSGLNRRPGPSQFYL
jgi:hypothetical protein